MQRLPIIDETASGPRPGPLVTLRDAGKLVPRRVRGGRSYRQGINNLTRPGVVQFFTCLMFDRIRIALQPLYMALHQVVFSLQAAQLTIQCQGILPLLPIYDQAVLPKDDVIGHRQRQHRGGACRHLPPADMGSLTQTNEGPRLPSICAHCSRTAHLTSKYKFQAPCRQVENLIAAWNVPSSYWTALHSQRLVVTSPLSHHQEFS
jgi:hypothetical protein